MLNSNVRTTVDRQALAVVFKDPRTLLAMEATMATVQDTPDAVNLAQATADLAIANATIAQATANTAVSDASTAQASANAAQATADGAVSDAATAQATADTAELDAAAAQATADGLVTALQSPTAANRLYGGPSSGAAAAPTFRALAVADLPTPPTFSASRITSQTIASGTPVKVQCATEDWDVGSCYDSVTNFRFTPNQAGKYLLTAAVSLGLATASTPPLFVSIYKNGAEYKRGVQLGYVTPGAIAYSLSVSTLAEANGSTDYFELFAFQATGSSETINGSAALTWFQGVFVAR